MKKQIPPKYADKLLEWYCRPELLEDLQGDLNEYFQRNLKEKGPKRARFIYWLDVLKFMRLYTLNFNLPAMLPFMILKNYVKTSSRNMARNKMFTAINVFGLAISLAVGLLALTLINEIYSYDRFHKKANRIYRITSTVNNHMSFATTSYYLGKIVEEEIPGIQQTAFLDNSMRGDFTFNKTQLRLTGLWASENIFQVFDFKLVAGDPGTALKEPYSLILTEKAALNLFGEKDALNQVVTYKENEYTVTGIAENVPKNSHIQFDVLGSLKTRELQLKNKEDHRFFNWNNLDHNHVYVLLEEQQDLTGINSSLQKIAKRENGLHNNTDIQVTLQALPDIIPGPVFINSIVFHLKSSWLWFLIGLAVIVIISACFNYTNLSMARTLQRAREVGIRKVVGASGLQVFYQFILEAMIISLSGLAIAYLLFHLIKPWALDIFPSRVYLEPSWSLLWQFFLLALLTGLLAGFVPSLVFSRLRLWGLIKGALTTRDPKKSGPKSVLMVFQFSISMVLIICTAMIYKQYNHSVNFNLGFRTEYILNLSLQGVDANQLRNSLKSIPEVETVSSSQKVLAAGSSSSAQLKLTATNDSIDRVCFNVVDDLYLQNFNHQLIAGSNFKALSRESEEAQFIINEKVLYELGIGNPSEIIGQEITFTDKKGTVVGVVEDFHHETIYSDVKPFVFMRFHKGKKPTYLNIKLSPENLVRTRQKIEEIWSGFDEIHPLQAGFYNDTFENVYEEYVNNAKVIGFMAFLSISISVLGLLGMVIFTTESKMKELSIRKIFGASEKALVFIIGKRFVALLLFSSVMAAPVIYYITHKYILSGIAYPATIDAPTILAGMVVLFLPALVVIGLQTVSAARRNPAEVLKE